MAYRWADWGGEQSAGRWWSAPIWPWAQSLCAPRLLCKLNLPVRCSGVFHFNHFQWEFSNDQRSHVFSYCVDQGLIGSRGDGVQSTWPWQGWAPCSSSCAFCRTEGCSAGLSSLLSYQRSQMAVFFDFLSLVCIIFWLFCFDWAGCYLTRLVACLFSGKASLSLDFVTSFWILCGLLSCITDNLRCQINALWIDEILITL